MKQITYYTQGKMDYEKSKHIKMYRASHMYTYIEILCFLIGESVRRKEIELNEYEYICEFRSTRNIIQCSNNRNPMITKSTEKN